MEKKIIICCYLWFVLQSNPVISRYVNNNCRLSSNLKVLRCHGNYPLQAQYGNSIVEIFLTNLTWRYLNLEDIVKKLPNIEKIFVNDSDIITFTLPPKLNNITVLSIRGTKLNNIPMDFMKFMPKLEFLSLENNKLVELRKDLDLGNLQYFYIKNNPWNCKKDLTWSLQLNAINVTKDIANCTCKEKYIGKRILTIAKFKDDMYKNCTKHCQCSLENVVQDAKTDKIKPIPIVMVNCSYRGMAEIPRHIPMHTRILHLEGNFINDLRSLKTNNMYKTLWDLYLDNNSITSISVLEGSYWLEHFRVFSLRQNKLSKLPAFAMDNALMKNPNLPDAVVLYLGGNPWRCDCIFVPVFQELVLQKYITRIADIRDVKCSYVEGDPNSLLPIINLSRSSVCMVPSDFSLQQGLDLLNGLLASLIIFILGKLAYDYYHFKKSGRLPWIVTKIP